MAKKSILDLFRLRILMSAILPIIVLAILILIALFNLINQQAKDSVKWQAQNMARVVNEYLLQQQILIAQASNVEEFKRVTVETGYSGMTMSTLQRQFLRSTDLSSVTIMNAEGDLVEAYPFAAYRNKSHTLKTIVRNFAKDANSTSLPIFVLLNDPSIDESIEAPSESSTYIVTISPLVIPQKTFENSFSVTGVIVSIFTFEKLQELLLASDVLSGSEHYIEYYFGENLITSDGGETIPSAYRDHAIVNALVNQNLEPTELAIYVSEPKGTHQKVILKSVMFTVVVIGVLIVFVMFFVRDIGAKIASPLNKIVSQSQAYGSGNYDSKIENLDYREFDEIEFALKKMGDKISEQIDSITHEKERAESSERLKTQFLANMSHEIRTPINGVLGLHSLLEKTPLNDNQKRMLGLAKSSAESLLGIINDILDFSKIEADKLVLEEHPFTPADVLADLAQVLAVRAADKDVELILDIAEIAGCECIGDKVRFQQVFSNIVGNAVKFTPRGEISIQASYTKVDDNLCEIECRVQDTGVGISTDQLRELFQSFTQADASTTRKFGGTGLGLVISKRICELMNGSISVQSEEGSGSCFTVKLQLPLKVSEIPQAPKGLSTETQVILLNKSPKSAQAIKNMLSVWNIKAQVMSELSVFSAFLKGYSTRARHIEDCFILIDESLYDEAIDLLEQSKIITKLIRLSFLNAKELVGAKDEKSVATKLHSPFTFDALADAMEQSSPCRFHSDEESMNDSPARQKQILVVEDNEINQVVIVGILEDYDYQVEVAGNGVVALEFLRDPSREFDIIVMDCQMPELDGYETTQHIREGKVGEYYQTIPIVALTANAMKGDREKCIDAGMDDYLTKPIEEDPLIAAIEKWLNRDADIKGVS